MIALHKEYILVMLVPRGDMCRCSTVKRKTFEKKECKNYLDINNRQKSMKSGILSPKFLKMKLFLEQIHKLESNKNKFKDKSKKFRKKEKINGKKNIQ